MSLNSTHCWDKAIQAKTVEKREFWLDWYEEFLRRESRPRRRRRRKK